MKTTMRHSWNYTDVNLSSGKSTATNCTAKMCSRRCTHTTPHLAPDGWHRQDEYERRN
jgi:hypothetical protein